MSRIAAAFAAHEFEPAPNMTVVVDAGAVFDGATLTEVAQQTSGTITAPVTNPRIDRVVHDRLTGTIQIVTGTEAASPVAPSIPAGYLPIARIALTTATTAITNAIMTDERIAASSGGGGVGRGLLNLQVFNTSGTYTPTPGTTMVVVEAIGAGGSGGGAKATGSGQVSVGGGGGGGSFGKGMYTSGFTGVTVTVAPFTASTSAGSAGSTGADSSFGSLLVAPGGFGGTAGNAVFPPAMTWGSNASVPPTGANICGGYGVSGFPGFALSTSALWGGRGAPAMYTTGSSGPMSPAGGVGGGNTAFNGGSAGSGAANPPSTSARAGGPGSPGLVIVYEYG